MNDLPAAVQSALRRLARRLAVGQFLDIWPGWAAASLLAAGLGAVTCRILFPTAAPRLHLLWVTPVLAALPAAIVCFVRAYKPAEVVALADSLGGGQGMLLTLFENRDSAWIDAALLEPATAFAMPRLRPWRRIAVLPPAMVFLAVAVWLPQRTPPFGSDAVLAAGIAAELTATVAELKQQAVVTPAEEKRLEEEIERIRRAAQERVDAAAWEAADAFRERVVASLAEKQDSVKWAEESLARYGAAAQGGANLESTAAAQSAELTKALEALARSGMLAGAPADLQQRLKGKLPTDLGSLRDLAASLSKYLGDTKGRFGKLAKLGKEFGRFDPAEFPLEADQGPGDGDGVPGRGGVNRGRADAALTWGAESLPFDRFKAQALPPGAARGPDDWAPLVVLPGAPRESAVLSTAAAARQYGASAGQNAWRRTLAPRHQSAVKKYFAK